MTTQNEAFGGVPVGRVAWDILAESMRLSSMAFDRDGRELHMHDWVRHAGSPGRYPYEGEVMQLLRKDGLTLARIVDPVAGAVVTLGTRYLRIVEAS